MNAVSDFYAVTINRYALAMMLAEGMRASSELRCGGQDPLTCRNNAVRSRRDLSSVWIDDPQQSGSVASSNAQYRMPSIPRGAVMVMMAGTPTQVFTGSGGTNTLSSTGVRSLARALNDYGRASTVIASYPDSVAREYVARTPIQRGCFDQYSCAVWALCPSGSVVYDRDVAQPREPSPQAETRQTHIEILDEPRQWNSDFWEWTRARPIVDGAHAIGASSSAPNYNSGWWVSFPEPWSRVFEGHPITADFINLNCHSGRTTSVQNLVGWGGWVRCDGAAAATKTPNAPGSPAIPLLTTAP